MEAAKRYIAASKYYPDMNARLGEVGGIFLTRNEKKVKLLVQNHILPECQLLYNDIRKHVPVGSVLSEKAGVSVDNSELQ